MLQVEIFIQDNKQALCEVRNLESLCFKQNQEDTPFKSRCAARKIYKSLLRRFEEICPAICTATHFLYWGSLKIRLANIFLDCGEKKKAYDVLQSCINRSKEFVALDGLIEIIRSVEISNNKLSKKQILVLNTLAGVLQSLFNLLAASTTECTKVSDPSNNIHEGSMHWLCCAKRVYELYSEFNSANMGPEFWDTLFSREWYGRTSSLLSCSSEEPQISIQRLIFEHGYTTTIFMLAQAYQLVGEPNQAATFCQLTLSRQLTFAVPLQRIIKLNSNGTSHKRSRPLSAHRLLDLDQKLSHKRGAKAIYTPYLLHPFDPVEWALNAATLGSYYSLIEEPTGCYCKTMECLAAATVVLEQETQSKCKYQKSEKMRMKLDDRVCNARADINRGFCQMGLKVLEKGTELLNNSLEFGESKNVKSFKDNAIKDFGSMFDLSLKSIIVRLMECGSHQSDDATDLNKMSIYSKYDVNELVLELATPPNDYKSASYIFRMILHCLSEAEEYYTIEDNCTEAVALIQDRSKAYRLMAAYEPQLTRQCRMHKRRVDMLDGVLQQLNPQHYLLLCRQLMFELAEALTTLRDLKKNIFDQSGENSQMAVHYARKTNLLTKRAISIYQDFLNSFRQPDHRIPTEFSEDDIRPVLMSHFYTARLYSRLVTTNTSEKIQSLNKALNFYTRTVNLADSHFRRHPSSTVNNYEEVQLAREMLILLPTKLHRLSCGENIED